MFKRKVLMGTACVAAAALAAGPAAADTLTGFSGYAKAEYRHQTFNDNPLSSSVDSNSKAGFGIGGALPVTGIPNLNVQVDASYATSWTNDYAHRSPNYCTPPASSGPSCSSTFSDSAAIWNFGITPFLAYAGSRWGMNLNYETVTGKGHLTNGGGFMEWYMSETMTVAAKAGYLHSGGTKQGGHGHYLAAQGTFYTMPNVALSVSADWRQLLTGGAMAQGTIACPRNCMLGMNGVFYSVEGEWLVNEEYGVSLTGSYTYAADEVFKQETNSSIFRFAVKYYTGSGSLLEHHRNGTLREFLRTP
jgi:hypothetical protein